MSEPHLSTEQLNLYLDQRLPDVNRRSVEAHLAACAPCQARLMRATHVKSALREQLGRERAPLTLQRAVRAQVDAASKRRRLRFPPRATFLALAAVAVVVLALGAAIATIRTALAPSPMLTQLAASHSGISPTAGQAETPQQLADRLSQQVGWRVPVPTVEGLALLGGQVDHIDGQAASHLLYQPATGATISLIIQRGDTPPLGGLSRRQYEGGVAYVGQQNGQSIVLWTANGMTYACVSPMDVDSLLDTASDIWHAVAAQQSATG